MIDQAGPARPRPLPLQAPHGGLPRRALAAPARAGPLPARAPSARRGAALWLRVNGSGGRGEQAEPALRGDARAPLRGRHQLRLPRGALRARLRRGRGDALPRRLPRAWSRRCAAWHRGRADRPGRRPRARARRVDDAPPEAVCPRTATASRRCCACSSATYRRRGHRRDEAERRFGDVVSALRLWAPGASAWARRAGAAPTRVRGSRCRRRRRGRPPGRLVPDGRRGAGLREFFTAVEQAARRSTSPGRAPLRDGLRARPRAEALSDYLLRCARCWTPPATPARRAWPCGWALCAEEGPRRPVQRRIEAAIALERFVMGGGPAAAPDGESPRELIGRGRGAPARAAARRPLRLPRRRPQGRGRRHPARDQPEPLVEIEARDLRASRARASRSRAVAMPDRSPSRTGAAESPRPEPEPEPDDQSDTAERSRSPCSPGARGRHPVGRLGFDDPEDYSAPV